MNTDEITSLGGKIIFDEISKLSNLEISLIIDDLKEDLLQASFPSGQILDIGWYPEFSENGSFKILLISNRDWDSPTYSETAKTWKSLGKALKNALKRM
ncbi:hypothetical protein [Pseudomonas sp. HMWF021]|uniref:hypothetical protein n=1 Tax=Pseudomonas sp. HMWF021 TaxID=2056857 RepID=UPI000D383C5E|nr:hypothetical protein [Pseudomonas sp. HMWF021]PTT32561.1 hypothetical protein DBR18_03290 [Pseudomonas sp. HMWF021]